MKRNGFTLVELIAIVVILGILLVIAMPKLYNTLNNSKYQLMEDSVKLIAKNAEGIYTENKAFDIESTIECANVMNYNADDYDKCVISFNNDAAEVILSGKSGSKFENIICSGNKDTVTCTANTKPILTEYSYVYSARPITTPSAGVTVDSISYNVFLRYPNNVVMYNNSTEGRAVCFKTATSLALNTPTSFNCIAWNNYEFESLMIRTNFNCTTSASSKRCVGTYNDKEYTCTLKQNGYVSCNDGSFFCTIDESGVESCSEVHTTDPIYPIDPNLPTE